MCILPLFAQSAVCSPQFYIDRIWTVPSATDLLFLIPWQLENLFKLSKLLCSRLDSGKRFLITSKRSFLNKKMADKDFIKDEVYSWSIVSDRMYQHSSGSGKIRKWQKHKQEKRNRSSNSETNDQKKELKIWNLSFKVVGKRKTKIEVRIPFSI